MRIFRIEMSELNDAASFIILLVYLIQKLLKNPRIRIFKENTIQIKQLVLSFICYWSSVDPLCEEARHSNRVGLGRTVSPYDTFIVGTDRSVQSNESSTVAHLHQPQLNSCMRSQRTTKLDTDKSRMGSCVNLQCQVNKL